MQAQTQTTSLPQAQTVLQWLNDLSESTLAMILPRVYTAHYHWWPTHPAGPDEQNQRNRNTDSVIGFLKGDNQFNKRRKHLNYILFQIVSTS